MAVIKSLAFCPKYKIKNITSIDDLGALSDGFTPFPLDIIHYILPMGLKFLPESFVALDKSRIKALITLQKEGAQHRRFKITKFFLERNSVETGEQIVNFIVARYCAKGASSFKVVFAQELDHMLDLFVNVCKFRICSYEYIYKTDSEKYICTNEENNNFKTYKNTQAKAVCELHNSSLNSHHRHTFIKHPSQFFESLISPIGKNIIFRYVLENEERGTVCAYFILCTQDNQNYLLETTLSSAYDGYFMDVVHFATKEISRRSKNWHLYIKVKSCYSNSQNLQGQLEFHKFEFHKKSLVLTKDFLRQVKQEDTILQNARIIFNTTAAEF